jgi:hypothetical protein
MSLWSTSPVDLGFGEVGVVEERGWPGMPIIAVIDQQNAVIGSRRDNAVQGYWSSAPAFVAAARMALERFRTRND